MHIWGSKQRGIVSNIERDKADVEVCIDFQKQAEKKWFTAGRYA
jgi:hypothetical protein